jgi:hypothetical protein
MGEWVAIVYKLRSFPRKRESRTNHFPSAICRSGSPRPRGRTGDSRERVPDCLSCYDLFGALRFRAGTTGARIVSCCRGKLGFFLFRLGGRCSFRGFSGDALTMKRQILWAGRALAAQRVALLQGNVDAGLFDLPSQHRLGACEEPEAEGDDENAAHFQFPDVLSDCSSDRFAECAAHSRAHLACGETSLLAPIVEAPLVADDSAVCGGSLIDGDERGEAREAESNDENFAHFPISLIRVAVSVSR